MIFQIKKVTETNHLNISKSYFLIQKQYWFFFWSTASRGNVKEGDSCSFSQSRKEYATEKQAQNGISQWKKNLYKKTHKIKILKAI